MNLLETAELFWRQYFPEPDDSASLKKYEVIATAKQIYAYVVWEQSMALKKTSDFEIPGQILQVATLNVKDAAVDISALKIQKGFPNESWAVSLKGVCRYIKSTANTLSMVDADDLPGKRYIVRGDELFFPDGTTDTKVTFTYAGMGEGVDGEIRISDELGDIIRRRLFETYFGKVGKEDLTSNHNSNV